jgi:hypothetical protein
MNLMTFWLILFGFFAYLIITDKSVEMFFILISKILRIEYQKLKWQLTQSPHNPIVRWLIWRRSMKLAKELQKELLKK